MRLFSSRMRTISRRAAGVQPEGWWCSPEHRTQNHGYRVGRGRWLLRAASWSDAPWSGLFLGGDRLNDVTDSGGICTQSGFPLRN